MTKSIIGTYSLFPAVILWGVLLGATVYSHTAFLPVYLSDLPHSAVVVTGKYGLNEAPFWRTIHPLLVLSLIAALALNWNFKARRKLLATSFTIYIIVLIVTALYFVPEIMAFATSPESNLPASEWLARGQRWERLSQIRGVWCFIGFIPLLVALTKVEFKLKESNTSIAA